MKKSISLIAAVAALGLAVPAAAQNVWGNTYDNRNGYDQGYSDSRLENRIEQLQRRIQAGAQRGTISRQEAVRLRDQLRMLVRLERQYSRNGLNRNERRDLQQRIAYFQQHLVQAERSREWRDNQRDQRDWRDDRRY